MVQGAASGWVAIEAVVVNFNAGETLARCIKSVLAQDESLRLTVVDNASTDGSADAAARLFGADPRFRLLCNDGNPGFAPAVNQAVDAGAEKYLLILNPDCEMEPGSLRCLRKALEGDPAAALAAPLVVDEQGNPRRGTLRRFPGPWRSLTTFSGLSRLGGRWPRFAGVEVTPLPSGRTVAEAVSGACMLLRRADFEAVGRMDAAYALHCEDLDLMYRLRQSGKYCLYVPEARVVHHQGLSSRSRPLWVHWQKHRGMQRFFRKHQAGSYAWPLRGLVVGGIWARWALTLPLVLLRR
jgi:GT2 family glycosyltransferase